MRQNYLKILINYETNYKRGGVMQRDLKENDELGAGRFL